MHVLCCKWIRWLVVDIEIKISDDGFQAEHWLTDIPCIGSEPYSQQQKNHYINVLNVTTMPNSRCWMVNGYIYQGGTLYHIKQYWMYTLVMIRLIWWSKNRFTRNIFKLTFLVIKSPKVSKHIFVTFLVINANISQLLTQYIDDLYHVLVKSIKRYHFRISSMKWYRALTRGSFSNVIPVNSTLEIWKIHWCWLCIWWLIGFVPLEFFKNRLFMLIAREKWCLVRETVECYLCMSVTTLSSICRCNNVWPLYMGGQWTGGVLSKTGIMTFRAWH